MTFDPTEVVQLAILNFVSSLAFGNRGRQDDPELKHLRSLLRNAVDNDPVNVHFCPILRFMPYYRNLIKVSKLFWNQESQFIMKKVKEIVDAGINEKSFVGAFVQSEGPNYDKADLRETTRNLLNAGSETTSFTVLNSLVLFANHPELQKRVQDEIDAGYNRQLFSSGFISFAVLTHFHRYWIVLVSFVERTLPCQRPLRIRVRLCTVLTYFGHLIRQTRKTLFRFQLWRPAYLRRHATSSSSCLQQHRQQPRQPPRLSSSISVATLNAHSLRKKYVPVSDFIESSELDVMVIVESWHHSSADVAVRRAAPPGFHFLDRPRYDDPLATERGGGIIVYHRDHLKAKKIELVRVPTTFEALAVSLASDRGPTTLLALYRPDSSRPTTAFYDEFIDLLDQFALYNTQLVLVGDLNLHLEDSSLPETVEFVAVLGQFGLKQHVTESTHVSGGWRDVVGARDDCRVSDVIVSPPTFSDHGPVVATIPFLCQPILFTMRRIRCWKRLDRAAFRMALRAHPLFADVESSAQLSTSEMFSKYEDALSGLLDTFAPICNIRSRHYPSTPWFDASCRALRRRARRLESFQKNALFVG